MALWYCSHQKSSRAPLVAVELDLGVETHEMRDVRRSVHIPRRPILPRPIDAVSFRPKTSRMKVLCHVLPRKTDRPAVVSVVVKRRRRAQKRGLEHSVLTECTRRSLIPWWAGIKRSYMLSKKFCIANMIEVHGPRRRHQFSGQAKRATKHTLV